MPPLWTAIPRTLQGQIRRSRPGQTTCPPAAAHRGRQVRPRGCEELLAQQGGAGFGQPVRERTQPGVDDAQRFDVRAPAQTGCPVLADLGDLGADCGRLGVGELLAAHRDTGGLADRGGRLGRGGGIPGQLQRGWVVCLWLGAAGRAAVVWRGVLLLLVLVVSMPCGGRAGVERCRRAYLDALLVVRAVRMAGFGGAVAGAWRGRAGPDGITVFCSVGLVGIEVAVAGRAVGECSAATVHRRQASGPRPVGCCGVCGRPGWRLSGGFRAGRGVRRRRPRRGRGPGGVRGWVPVWCGGRPCGGWCGPGVSRRVGRGQRCRRIRAGRRRVG